MDSTTTTTATALEPQGCPGRCQVPAVLLPVLRHPVSMLMGMMSPGCKLRQRKASWKILENTWRLRSSAYTNNFFALLWSSGILKTFLPDLWPARCHLWPVPSLLLIGTTAVSLGNEAKGQNRQGNLLLGARGQAVQLPLFSGKGARSQGDIDLNTLLKNALNTFFLYMYLIDIIMVVPRTTCLFVDCFQIHLICIARWYEWLLQINFGYVPLLIDRSMVTAERSSRTSYLTING